MILEQKRVNKLFTCCPHVDIPLVYSMIQMDVSGKFYLVGPSPWLNKPDKVPTPKKALSTRCLMDLSSSISVIFNNCQRNGLDICQGNVLQFLQKVSNDWSFVEIGIFKNTSWGICLHPIEQIQYQIFAI